MFVKLKTLVNATAFGLALLAGHTAQAVTINAGPLTLGGPPLSFTGDTTTHGYDVYNFTLPYDILAGNGLWLHMETGNANYENQYSCIPVSISAASCWLLMTIRLVRSVLAPMIAAEVQPTAAVRASGQR